MKKQITIGAFICGMLIGGSYLVGANQKSGKLKNQEPYTPTRAEWAELWLMAQVTRFAAVQPDDFVKLDFVILDIPDGKQELLCKLIYRDTTEVGRIGQSVGTMRKLAKDAVVKFELDVDIVESVHHLGATEGISRYEKHPAQRRKRLPTPQSFRVPKRTKSREDPQVGSSVPPSQDTASVVAEARNRKKVATVSAGPGHAIAKDATPASFIGNWTNEDPNTHGITRVQISTKGASLAVQIWSACPPMDCGWGEETTKVSDADDGMLSLQWNSGFETRNQRVTILDDGRLRVEEHTHFTNKFGRSDYDSVDYFAKTFVPSWAKIDQKNTTHWEGGAANIQPENLMEQSFKPTFRILLGVDIGISTGNASRGGDTITMEIINVAESLCSVSQYVKEGFEGLLHFDIPAGINVTPGEILQIRVRDTGKIVFWWRYNRDRYPNGTRFLFGKPRPKQDWIFQTYGRAYLPSI